MRRYSFDLDSNRTGILENGVQVAGYDYNPGVSSGVDQLTSVTENGVTRSFSYDTDGNTTARGSDTLSWDAWGRHTGGSFAGGTVSYGFDPAGFRRSRTTGSTTTRYLHGGLIETDPTGSINLFDIDGPAGDLAHVSGTPLTAPVSYRYYNAHGDLTATANSTGTRNSRLDYEPFGQLRTGSAGTGTSELFTGRWDKKHDTLSGLVEMGVRPYDAVLGRFLAVDPIEGGALNAYDYGLQNPVNEYDLDGTCVPVCLVPVIALGSAAVVGGIYLYDKTQKPTPRKKSAAQLRKEWEEIHNRSWPTDPRSGKPYIAHHRVPLADGGDDHGSNIEPMKPEAHTKHHSEKGDFKRWGKRTKKKKRK